MKTNLTASALITLTLMSVAAFAGGKGGHSGNGGDALLTSEFYTITERLSRVPEFADMNFHESIDQKILIDRTKENLQVVVKDAKGNESLTPVDAVSEVEESGRWHTTINESVIFASCETKYKLFMHENLVLKKRATGETYEESNVWNITTQKMELIKNKLDCTLIGEDYRRIRLKAIQALIERAGTYKNGNIYSFSRGDKVTNDIRACYHDSNGNLDIDWIHKQGALALFSLKKASIEQQAVFVDRACYEDGRVTLQKARLMRIQDLLEEMIPWMAAGKNIEKRIRNFDNTDEKALNTFANYIQEIGTLQERLFGRRPVHTDEIRSVNSSLNFKKQTLESWALALQMGIDHQLYPRD